MKIYHDGRFSFICDSCRMVAGEDEDEREARKKAQEVARVQGWKLAHPGWQFFCPNCKGA